MANFTPNRLKKICGILLVGNLIFFITMNWGRELLNDPTADPALRTLHAEQIRILSETQIQAASAITAASAPEATSPPVSEISASSTPIAASAPVTINETPTTSNVAAIPTTTPPEAATTEKLSCMEWGNFNETDLANSRTALIKLHLADKVVTHNIPQNNGYWVYIPPLPDRATINQKIAHLKEHGINEYFVVKDPGPRQNAISLGVYKTKEAAQSYLKELHNKNVQGAEAGEHDRGKLSKFVLHDINSEENNKLKALKKEFPNSEFKNIACKH